ncbi:hypothetical protein GCM10018953_10150 [Streptosporangium nondiastaticum]
MAVIRSIPTPRGLPVFGNTLQIPAHSPAAFFDEVAAEHEEGIFQLDLLGRQVLFVYDPDLVAEVCDETRFYKGIDPPLSIVRDFSGDGLFTARHDEPVWGQAHRILMPAFSQRSMKVYFPQMLEVAEALVDKWARSDRVNVPEDMTRLTLDTISLTGFGYRFDSFSSDELHPFLRSMGNALTEAMLRNRQLPVVTRLKKKREEDYRADIRVMQDLVDDVIKRRREGDGGGTGDLLGLMLEAADPRTGERLSDENIRNQVLTFLIAGHETTSGLLSFALYNLLRNPHVLALAYAEVDRLLPGDTTPTYETIMKLDVIPRILEETLRIWSPIPAFAVKAFDDTAIGGYPVREGQTCVVLLPSLHRHPKAWDRPEEFDIDRWLPENRSAHHPAAYKPFGNGERACIGRQFALTEARLALAMVLQRLAVSDPDVYRMRIKQTLTLKPDDFTIGVRERRPYERGTAGGRGGGRARRRRGRRDGARRRLRHRPHRRLRFQPRQLGRHRRAAGRPGRAVRVRDHADHARQSRPAGRGRARRRHLHLQRQGARQRPALRRARRPAAHGRRTARAARLRQHPVADLSGLPAPRLRQARRGRGRTPGRAGRGRRRRRLRRRCFGVDRRAVGGAGGRVRRRRRGERAPLRDGGPHRGRRAARRRVPGRGPADRAVQRGADRRPGRSVGLLAGGAAARGALHRGRAARGRDLHRGRPPGRLRQERP